MKSFIDYEAQVDGMVDHISMLDLNDDGALNEWGASLRPIHEHALLDLFFKNRLMRKSKWISDDIFDHIYYREIYVSTHGWSMQSRMVGRNATLFNEDIEYTNSLHQTEDCYPLSWRRSEWEDVDGEEIAGVYYPSYIELVY
jgi:hypothetical protein